MRRFVMVVAVVLAAATWSFGAQIVINFTEASSRTTTLFADSNFSNLGGEPEKVSGPLSGAGQMFPLFYFDMTPLAGATINSASFTANGDAGWGAPHDYDNIIVRRIHTPAGTPLWEQGSGTWGTRWNNLDNACWWFVDWDKTAGYGHTWAGTYQNWIEVTEGIISAIGSEEIDNNALHVGGSGAWDVQVLVQNWADGTWENQGLVLDTRGDSATNALQMQSISLTIDYTMPIPEPATMALVGTGIAAFVGFARRRRR